MTQLPTTNFSHSEKKRRTNTQFSRRHYAQQKCSSSCKRGSAHVRRRRPVGRGTMRRMRGEGKEGEGQLVAVVPLLYPGGSFFLPVPPLFPPAFTPPPSFLLMPRPPAPPRVWWRCRWIEEERSDGSRTRRKRGGGSN